MPEGSILSKMTNVPQIVQLQDYEDLDFSIKIDNEDELYIHI